jgi:hypothetical protein
LYHSPQFRAGCATRGLNRDPLNHRHYIAGKIGGVGIPRQVSFCLRALETLADGLLSRVTAQNEIVSNAFCFVAARQRALDKKTSPRIA